MIVGEHPEGTVCWVDLGSPDVDRAEHFYSSLFDWTVTIVDDTGYRLCALRGALVAALGPAEDAGSPYWTVNISVTDLDAAVERFAAAGAEIVIPPTSTGTLGRYAVTRDPVGAPVSLWEPADQTGMGLAREPGTFAEISLCTEQSTIAAQFYETALGWVPEPESTFRLPDDSHVVTRPAPQPPTTQQSLWLVTFGSANIDNDTANALRLGATDLTHDADSNATVLRDPTGALFRLRQT